MATHTSRQTGDCCVATIIRNDLAAVMNHPMISPVCRMKAPTGLQRLHFQLKAFTYQHFKISLDCERTDKRRVKKVEGQTWHGKGDLSLH